MDDSHASERVEHLFIVRVWHEPSSGGPMPWRGSVEHAPTRSRRYFGALEELQSFIARHLSEPGAQGDLPGGRKTPG